MKIYLDYAASTPLDPNIAKAMADCAQNIYANPSAIYRSAQKSAGILHQARATVADLLGVSPAEIYFTSGATESNNLAIAGLALHNFRLTGKGRIWIGAAEHSSVEEPAKALARYFPIECEQLATNSYGQVNELGLKQLQTEYMTLCALSYGSSEIGSIQPLQQVAEILQQRCIPLHIDATQAANYCSLKSIVPLANSLSLSGHKMYGPRGVGVLYVRQNTPIDPWLQGGRQESSFRAGTENVAAILGFAMALQQAQTLPDKDVIQQLSSAFCAYLRKELPEIIFTGHPQQRLPHIVSLLLPQCDSYETLIALDMHGVEASFGSACHLTGEALPLLTRIGFNEQQARSAIRFSLGRFTTLTELEKTAHLLAHIVKKQTAGSL